MFPFWFLRYALYSIFEILSGGQPAFGLTVRRIVSFGNVGILEASDRGDSATVKRLLCEQPASVDDSWEGSGCTALHYAIVRYRIDTVKILLHAGANPEAEDFFGQTARQLAFIYSRTGLHPFRKALGEALPLSPHHMDALNFTLVHKCVLGILSIDLPEILQAKDAMILEQVNSTDALGYTPLQWAVRLDDLEAAEELLRAGARTDIRNNMGAPPLTNAMMTATASCGKILIDAGADPCAANKCGIQPLHFACMYKHLTAVELLVNSGADVNCRSIDGLTPLLLATKSNAIDIMEYLLEHDADIEMGDENDEFCPLLFHILQQP